MAYDSAHNGVQGEKFMTSLQPVRSDATSKPPQMLYKGAFISDGKYVEVWWVVATAKTKSRMAQMAWFRVAKTSTHSHNGPITHYKAYTDVY